MSGFVCQLLLSPGRGNPLEPMGYPLSDRGVIIDDEGMIPILRTTKWQAFGNQPSAEITIRRQVEVDFKSFYGKQTWTYVHGQPKLLAKFEHARAKTISCYNLLKTIPISLCPTNPSVESAYEAKKVYYQDIPGGQFVTAVSFKSTLPEMVARLLREICEAARKMYQYLRDKWEEYKRRNAQSEPKGKEEEAPEDDTIRGDQPLNVVWRAQGALGRISKLLRGSKHAVLQSAGNRMRQVANVLAKPFPNLSDIGDEEVFAAFAQLLLVMGTTLVERVLSLCFGDISAFIVGLVEFILICSSEETITTAALSVLVSAAGHLLLAIMPWWLSVPAHLIYDLWATGTFDQIYRMFEQHGARGVGRLFLKGLREFFERVKFAIGLKSENGDLSVDQCFAVDYDVVNPLLEDWQAVYPPLELDIKLNDRVFTKEDYEVARTTMPNKYSSKQAVPLVDLPILQRVALTTGHLDTLISAVALRYGTITPAPRDVHLWARSAMASVLQHFAPFKNSYRPYTWDEFESHMQEHNYSKSKQALYRKARRKFLLGIAASTGNPFSGKDRELLKQTPAAVVKTRIVHLYQPDQHYPDILEALGIKRALKEAVPEIVIKRGKWKITYYRPLKGTTTEMAEAMGGCNPFEIKICYSGDDMCMVVVTKSGTWFLAADLKAADTTIQDQLLRVVHEILQWWGVSKEATDRNWEMNTGKKTASFYTDQGVQTITLQLEHAINSSGTCFTTVITDIVMQLLTHLTIQNWDGDINTLVKSLCLQAERLGLKLELEHHKGTIDNQLTPPGYCSFLSCVPIFTTSGKITVIPKSFTKRLIFKGPVQADKGLSIDFAAACRANEPALRSTPMGLAILGALRRHVQDHPVDVGLGEYDASAAYKVAVDNEETISVEDEMEYYEHFVEGFSPEMYTQEIQVWDSISEFPAKLPPGALPIFTAMAQEHYGYSLPPEETSPFDPEEDSPSDTDDEAIDVTR